MTDISLSSSQDILSLINEKEPITKGIFIISLDGTMCKTLMEKLDSGEEVDIKHQSVHVVAWLLKVGNIFASSTLWISLSLHE